MPYIAVRELFDLMYNGQFVSPVSFKTFVEKVEVREITAAATWLKFLN